MRLLSGGQKPRIFLSFPMAALGHLQSFTNVSREWLLSGVKRTSIEGQTDKKNPARGRVFDLPGSGSPCSAPHAVRICIGMWCGNQLLLARPRDYEALGFRFSAVKHARLLQFPLLLLFGTRSLDFASQTTGTVTQQSGMDLRYTCG